MDVIKKHYRLILFVIGLAGVLMLALNTNPEGLDWKDVFSTKLLLLLAGLMVLWAGIYMIHATAFKLIIGPEASEISRSEMYRICVSGFALNNVTPAGLVGGEPYRILELRNHMSAEKATLSTVTFSLMYVMGHVFLWLTGIFIYFCMGCPGDGFITALMIVAALILIAICVYFFTFKHSAIIRTAFSLISKVPLIGMKAEKIAEKNAQMIERIDRCYEAFYRNKENLVKVVMFEYCSRLLEGLEYFLIVRYLGVHINISGGILILSLASLIGNLFFMIPMQAGTREGGTALALDILGVSMGTCFAASLIYRIRDLICTAIGIALILVGGKKRSHGTDKTTI